MTIREGIAQGLNLEQYSDAPIFNTKAVVQQTGVPAPTLRAWERRYTLITPERANNAYRLYSERDVALIRWLKERIDEGMSISQAIAFFRHLSEEAQSGGESSSRLLDAFVESPATFEVTVAAPPPLPSLQRVVNKASPARVPGGREGRREKRRSVGFLVNEASAIPTIPNLGITQETLIESFKQMDEATASIVMGSLLAVYPVEQICVEVITPIMWKVGQLWVEGQITVSVEHFASSFFRGILTNLLHITPSSATGPCAIVCCAPGEPHELASLMLALFLRRRNLHVIYLGQSIETAGLLDTIRRLAPTLVCVSLTMPTYLSALINLGRQIQQLPAPRPAFVFGGQVFKHFKDIVSQIYGIHLDGDMRDIAEQLRAIVMEPAYDQIK
jgi:DNA-binding transcriptional MerR regulator